MAKAKTNEKKKKMSTKIAKQQNTSKRTKLHVETLNPTIAHTIQTQIHKRSDNLTKHYSTRM